jgi:hypothetical protein
MEMRAGMRRITGAWRSIMAVGAMAATLLTATAQQPSAAATPATIVPSLKVVTDPQHRFTIAIPSNWLVKTSTDSRSAAVSANSPAAAGSLSDSVDVVIQDFDYAISPQSCLGDAATVMRFTIHSWTTLHEGPATLAGMPAYSRVYRWRTASGQPRRSIQTCVTVGRRAFVVVGTTDDTTAAVNQRFPVIQQIIASFRPNLSNVPAPASVPAVHTGK